MNQLGDESANYLGIQCARDLRTCLAISSIYRTGLEYRPKVLPSFPEMIPPAPGAADTR